MGGLVGIAPSAGANWRSQVNHLRHETRALNRRTTRRRKKEARRLLIQSERGVKDAGKLAWHLRSLSNDVHAAQSSLAPTDGEGSSIEEEGAFVFGVTTAGLPTPDLTYKASSGRQRASESFARREGQGLAITNAQEASRGA